MKKITVASIIILALSAGVFAQADAKLNYMHGSNIKLGESGAVVTTGTNFKFLNNADTRALLQFWGNPDAPSVLGAIVPENFTPAAKDGWAAIVYYDADGYVSDAKAKDINYDQLLKQMQEGTKSRNAARKQQGYESIELAGWADAPKYDAVNHKTTWGEDLVFGDEQKVHSLNYSVRVLGRRGVLNVRVIAGISDLAAVKAAVPSLLKTVDFTAGNRYEDYNASSDKRAEYDLRGMIAGGSLLAVAAKTGLLAKLAALLVAGKKFIFMGIAALVAMLRGRKREA